MKPTQQQLERCELMGWEYLGDGLFSKGEKIGLFTESEWIIH